MFCDCPRYCKVRKSVSRRTYEEHASYRNQPNASSAASANHSTRIRRRPKKGSGNEENGEPLLHPNEERNYLPPERDNLSPERNNPLPEHDKLKFKSYRFAVYVFCILSSTTPSLGRDKTPTRRERTMSVASFTLVASFTRLSFQPLAQPSIQQNLNLLQDLDNAVVKVILNEEMLILSLHFVFFCRFTIFFTSSFFDTSFSPRSTSPRDSGDACVPNITLSIQFRSLEARARVPLMTSPSVESSSTSPPALVPSISCLKSEYGTPSSPASLEPPSSPIHNRSLFYAGLFVEELDNPRVWSTVADQTIFKNPGLSSTVLPDRSKDTQAVMTLTMNLLLSGLNTETRLSPQTSHRLHFLTTSLKSNHQPDYLTPRAVVILLKPFVSSLNGLSACVDDISAIFDVTNKMTDMETVYEMGGKMIDEMTKEKETSHNQVIWTVNQTRAIFSHSRDFSLLSPSTTFLPTPSGEILTHRTTTHGTIAFHAYDGCPDPASASSSSMTASSEYMEFAWSDEKMTVMTRLREHILLLS
ncbi:hypothetical protein BT96DRAFT_984155 [Gymnopus androsaceus JB14]|uniref:Uncharacterized protein n=1 Tax=Gymnopus androsaceus JB14 TaxID=1447944 RepID=A0A6A4IJK4_9AGAR|nr:hypothetical protein BT96DRAFT_984155 [Gymnopus androsaceus JB14]